MALDQVHIRPYASGDRDTLLALAPRLTEGIAPWLDPAAMLAAAHDWIAGGIDRLGPDSAIFVAEDGQGAPLGFVSVARQRHFTGEERAYIGELVVTTEAEGQGVGRALIAEAARWARANGLPALELDTGATNARARGFYQRLGFGEESVKMVLRLDPVRSDMSARTIEEGQTTR